MTETGTGTGIRTVDSSLDTAKKTNNYQVEEAKQETDSEYIIESNRNVPVGLGSDEYAVTQMVNPMPRDGDSVQPKRPTASLSLNVSPMLEESLMRQEFYPVNITSSRTSDLSSLAAAKERVLEMERVLFVDKEELIEVCIRDFDTGDGRARDKMNVHSDTKLSSYLGLEVSEVGEKAFFPKYRVYKRDPKCRFIYIYGQDSRSRLKIKRKMLSKILTYHQVMPDYLDYVFLFGAQSVPQDSRFSSFREQTTLRYWPGRVEDPSLGRSGYQYQLCYNLKGVTLKSKDPVDQKQHQWSIRQAAVHHQFDVKLGTTLWIVIKGGRDILDLFKDHTGPKGRAEDKTFDSLGSCFISSLAIHRMLCGWATHQWRWYNRWLGNVVLDETAMAVYGPRGPSQNYRIFKPSDIQTLQTWDEQNREIITSLESNITIVGCLRSYYSKLIEREDFPDDLKIGCKDATVLFLSDIDGTIKEFEEQLTSAKTLAAVITDRRKLIKQHMQTQASERIEKLNVNMEREAIAMKIITVLTLFFLPPTFVATLFSTDLIRYNGNQEAFSSKALLRWLEVSLPLTFLTLILAYVSYNFFQPYRANEKERSKKWFGWAPLIFRRAETKVVDDSVVDTPREPKRGSGRDKWSLSDSFTSLKLQREKKAGSLLGV